MSFLPKGYEAPKGQSKYFRFEDGANKFRIVSGAITGYEYWTMDNKPVRLIEFPEKTPSDIRPDSKIKHFWAFAVLDRKDGEIKVCELTQVSIMKSIKAMIDSEEWGDPKDFDITVTRSGQKLETDYAVQPSPHKMLTAEEMELVADTPVNLEALFDGEDPFVEKITV